MTEYTFTILDTTGIQSYIFHSNRLRENIGASQLVKEATGDWVKQTLIGLGIPLVHQHDPIETSGLPAELIYASGGNAQIIFRERKTAIEFTHCLSRKVLEQARGIKLLAAHKTFDWEREHLHGVVDSFIKHELDTYKHTRIPSSPLLGLSVTVDCNSTQLPAVGLSTDYHTTDDETDDPPYPISNEILSKRQAAIPAQKELNKLFELPNRLVFPRQLDHLGRTEHESSYIAIVHADGNGMGKRFQDYGRAARNNRDYINRMRDFSSQVDSAGKAALTKVIQTLVNAIDCDTGTLSGEFNKFDLSRTSDRYYLPFRPLVYGGDDVTFICDGRLGLELAIIYLQEFASHTMPDDKKLTACAGIGLVKTHYPFARAYALSQALCDSGKASLRNQKIEGSVIDWHIANTGLLGNLSAIREREYRVSSGQLNLRPLLLQDSGNWQTWEAFLPVLTAFYGDAWRDKRNKVMALREVLTKGPVATRQFLQNYRQGDLPRFASYKGVEVSLAQEGWVNGVCGYFDAIDAMDFYLGLPTV
jgi:hypothetical protein